MVAMLKSATSPALAMLKPQSSGPAAGAEKKGRPLDPATLAKIDQAAKDFEGMFLGEMIKPVFETVKTDTIFGGGKGEEVFRGMMVQEYGKKMAERGGLGIAPYVRNEMIRLQEEANNK